MNTNTPTQTTITLDVRVAGQVRPVEFVQYGDRPMAFSAPVFAARIGAGTKLHRVDGQANLRADGTWKMQGSTVVRNRTALIVGWADEAAGTAQATAQTYYGSL